MRPRPASFGKTVFIVKVAIGELRADFRHTSELIEHSDRLSPALREHGIGPDAFYRQLRPDSMGHAVCDGGSHQSREGANIVGDVGAFDLYGRIHDFSIS